MDGGRAPARAIGGGIGNGEAGPLRVEWIDIARGLGIIAVVAGHVWTRGPVRDAIYSFHMPLFFLMSGWLHRPKPPLSFARRQIATQMLSYGAFLALVLLADWAIETGKGHRPIFHDWPADLWRVAFGGSELRGPFTVFWFVPCLVAARVAFNALNARFPDVRSWTWAGIAAVMLAAAEVLGDWTDTSPLGLLTVPMAVALLWAGAAARGEEWRGWRLWVLVPIAAIGLGGLAPTINMKAGDYGWPLVSMASAVATSLLIFRAAQWLERTPRGATGWLKLLGSASLVIMYLHVPVVHYGGPYLAKGWLLALGLAVPVGAYWVFGRFGWTRRVFLAG